MTTSFLFERVAHVAPLGLRFWDMVAGAPVTSGLTVTATPAQVGLRRVAATVSTSGIYGFAHLPGLHELQQGEGDRAFWQTMQPASKRDFVISVFDEEGRFFPCRFPVRAPVRGLFGFTCVGARVMPAVPAGSVPLFSLPSRRVLAGTGVVRVEYRPAVQARRWAVVEARHNGKALGWGMTDAAGQCALFFPYPPPTARKPLYEQSWQIDLLAFHAMTMNSVDSPELCAILKQPPIPPRKTTLTYGQEAIAR